MNLNLVLLIAALILFILDGLGVGSGRIRLTPMGLACWVLSLLLG